MSEAKERLKAIRTSLQKQSTVATNGSIDIEMIAKLEGFGSARALLGIGAELHRLVTEVDAVIASLSD